MQLHLTSTRRVLIAGLMCISTLSSNETMAAASAANPAAAMHEAGVRYVLEHLGSTPRDRMAARVRQLTTEYCTKAHCSPSGLRAPSARLSEEAMIEEVRGSAALKAEARRFAAAVRAARNVTEVRSASLASVAHARKRLGALEFRRFSRSVEIGVSSAALWAPRKLGGRGGGGITFPAGGSSAQMDIDWHEVGEADTMGCLATIEIGCIDGAIVASAANIAWQLIRD
jgi:hypothetical protein